MHEVKMFILHSLFLKGINKAVAFWTEGTEKKYKANVLSMYQYK